MIPKTLWADGDLACVIRSGQVWCWGRNGDHLLGPDAVAKPTRLNALDGAVAIDFSSYGPGPQRAYGLLADGTVRVVDKSGTSALPDVHDAIDLATTYFVACVLLNGGDVQCVEPGAKAAPLPAPTLQGVRAIFADDVDGFCALGDRAITCWNYVPGRSSLEMQPPQIIDDIPDVRQIAVTYGSACALTGAGDIIALDIRYGIVDRNTLRGPESFLRLDKALTATDPLAADFLAGKALDAEDKRRLTDRISALGARRRAADAAMLYETLLARDIPVPLWAERDLVTQRLAKAVLAGALAVGIAFLTISFQSVKAALANPVSSLRSE